MVNTSAGGEVQLRWSVLGVDAVLARAPCWLALQQS